MDLGVEDRFIIILNRFCYSLAAFVEVVIHPTQLTTNLIRQKKKRSISFDNYVVSVEEFNELMSETVAYVKRIILTLNNLFMYKTLDKLTDFLESLKDFLSFLIEKNVLLKLNDIKEKLDNRFDRKVRLVERIGKIKILIFRLFDLTIDITSIFIPQFSMIKQCMNVLEERNEYYISQRVDYINKNRFNVEEIIKQLLDMELRSQIIINLQPEKIFKDLEKKDVSYMLEHIESLQCGYIEMMQISTYLRTEIEKYKKRSRGFLMILKDAFSINKQVC